MTTMSNQDKPASDDEEQSTQQWKYHPTLSAMKYGHRDAVRSSPEDVEVEPQE
jgi:hypothetical protein